MPPQCPVVFELRGTHLVHTRTGVPGYEMASGRARIPIAEGFTCPAVPLLTPLASVYETEGHRFESCLARPRKPCESGAFGLKRSDHHAGWSGTMWETPRGLATPRPRPATGSAPKAVGRMSGQTTLHAGPFAPLDAWCEKISELPPLRKHSSEILVDGCVHPIPAGSARPKCRGAREHRDLDLYSHLMPGGEDEALALVDAY